MERAYMGQKGVTMIELLTVFAILGFAASIVIPNLVGSSEQTYATVAQTNLYAISAAQQKYFETMGAYCLAGCGDTNANIISNLHMSFSPTEHYSYSCTAAAPYYTCTATSRNGLVTLTMNVTAAQGAVITCAGAAGYCPL